MGNELAWTKVTVLQWTLVLIIHVLLIVCSTALCVWHVCWQKPAIHLTEISQLF